MSGTKEKVDYEDATRTQHSLSVQTASTHAVLDAAAINTLPYVAQSVKVVHIAAAIATECHVQRMGRCGKMGRKRKFNTLEQQQAPTMLKGKNKGRDTQERKHEKPKNMTRNQKDVYCHHI